MEQQGSDITTLERKMGDAKQAGVPKRDVSLREVTVAAAPPAPPTVARLDLSRKILLGLAGVLTLLWFCFLAWGAVRLIGMWFF
jgi:hypothetical protein